MDYLAYTIAHILTYGVMGYLLLCAGCLALGLFNAFFDRPYMTRAQRIAWDQAQPSFFWTHRVAFGVFAVAVVGTGFLSLIAWWPR
jgi:hypothetical protein